MLKDELQSYLKRVFPSAKIDTPHSLCGDVHIRFELGEEFENGTIERVQQSTNRATTIFNDAFPDAEALIYVVIYEYPESGFNKSNNEYLLQQFPEEQITAFYNQVETINTAHFTTDENGEDIFEKEDVRLIIGKLPAGEINILNILNGIANSEMGFEPSINQSIYFFEPSTDRGFYMYDDRGCYVWSNNADKIRDIYIKRNDWIPEYHRAEIDAYFL